MRRQNCPQVALECSVAHRSAFHAVLRETLFRSFLVVRINVTTHEQLEKEIYIGAATASMVALLVGQDRDRDDYDDWLSEACSMMMTRVAQLEALAEARRVAAERYLHGREALFPSDASAWDAQLKQTRERAAIALRLAELHEVAVDEHVDGAEDRVDRLLADLVEPAKAMALEKLGEGERGLRIARSWLRAKLT